MEVFMGTFPSLSRRQIDLHGCSWKKFLKCFSVCVLYKCITLNKRPKWYAMKSLHSNAAAIKRILFFLQYKLVLYLSSTHWSNPIGCRWHDHACYHYWQNWVHEFVCVYFQVPISAALETIATPMQPASTWQQGLPVSVCQVTVAMAFIVKVNQQPFCQ